EKLVSQGYKKITLLGQNVNSYGKGDTGISFPELLRRVCRVDGVERIGFMTSHPKDATEELFEAIRDEPKASRRFHLPLQSGSNRVLKLMNRKHSIEDYRRKVGRLRKLVPDVSVTTDFIVGFPSETKEDFEMTLRAVREIQFDDAYIFKYSQRDGTKAAGLPDDVPRPEKERRNQVLLNAQGEVRDLRNRQWVGKVLTVLADRLGSKKRGELLGYSPQDKKVVFEGSARSIGKVVAVRIEGVNNETLLGSLVEKGDN
ncbi:MAG: MiaB/RimO family radical SAM methylthiotransferase, partial [Candidatus Omnitrophica bacterium]|nr:MiaB/RimO family radical SAM methylthiotransferase [Candidatus Omnitrophota bacterium]